MANGRILRIVSVTALALLALLLTTPVFAGTPEDQSNADSARYFYQQVWFSEKPELVDQLLLLNM